MGGNTLKKIETLAALGEKAEQEVRTGRYSLPKLDDESLAAYRLRLQRDGTPEDLERLNRAVRTKPVRNLLRLH